jgi:hypothetical protein
MVYMLNCFSSPRVMLRAGCNMVFMMLEHYNMTPTWAEVTKTGEIVFTALFTVEVGLTHHVLYVRNTH